MEKIKAVTILVSVLILISGGLIAFYINSQNSRFFIVMSPDRPFAYKIDRKTGKTWRILHKTATKVEVEETSWKSPEEEAINLAKKSYALGKEIKKAENVVKERMRQKKGHLRIFGWTARKIDEQVYLVFYGFDQGSGERNYVFEVNLVEKIVRNVLHDPELEQIYFPEPVQSEKFINGIDQTEEILKKFKELQKERTN